MILWVDGDPSRAATVYRRWPAERVSNTIWCRTAQEAIFVLEQPYDIDEINIEHDLESTDSRSEYSGMEVVRWLERNTPNNKNLHFIAHTHSPAGRSMVERVRRAGIKADLAPFGY